MGTTNITYGFTQEVDIGKLEGNMVPVLIDTPYNVIAVSQKQLNVTISAFSSSLMSYSIRMYILSLSLSLSLSLCRPLLWSST